jgi:hypothetical protein
MEKEKYFGNCRSISEFERLETIGNFFVLYNQERELTVWYTVQ